MRQLIILSALLGFALLTARCDNSNAQKKPNPYYSRTSTTPVTLTDAQWKKILPADVYHIARQEGTDPAFQSKYNDNHKKGIYYCAVCGNRLYSSDAKFESGTGWPSFFQPYSATSSVELKEDADGSRTEVRCKRCDAHLGHMFHDGPKPTGLRYCMDGTVLDFEPAK